MPTLEEYLGPWCALRRALGRRTADTDRARLRLYALPPFGQKPLDAISTAEIAQWVSVLVEAGLAPRTVRHAYRAMSSLMRSAAVHGLIKVSPCQLGRADLPPDIDKDPERAARAPLSPAELVALCTCPDVPLERRMIWMVLGLTGARISEAAALQWSDLDTDAAPLWRLTISAQWDLKRRERIPLKTHRPRLVPVLPALADALGAWRARGWARVAGRMPHPSEPILINQRGGRISKYTIRKALIRDLGSAGLRTHHTTHHLRNTFRTLCRNAGCRDEVIGTITHAAKRDALERYTVTTWSTLCAEIVRVDLGELAAPELQTGDLTGG